MKVQDAIKRKISIKRQIVFIFLCPYRRIIGQVLYILSKTSKARELFVPLVCLGTKQTQNVLYLVCLNLLIPIINLRSKSMKVYELEYKMKNSRHIKDITDLSRLKTAKKAVNIGQNDDFLQSAQDFYIKNNFRREAQPVKYPNHQMNAKQDNKDDPATHIQRSSKAGTSRITPDNVKRSVERDYSNNLQHWRKETFKYQEQVFALERKNTELMAENNNLRYELKLRQGDRNGDSKIILLNNPQLQAVNNEKAYLQKRVKQLQSQLQQKGKRLSQLETVLKIISEKFQQNTSTIFDKTQQNDLLTSSVEILRNQKDIQKTDNSILIAQSVANTTKPTTSKDLSQSKNQSNPFSILKPQ